MSRKGVPRYFGATPPPGGQKGERQHPYSYYPQI
jgi:hypothetical protein